MQKITTLLYTAVMMFLTMTLSSSCTKDDPSDDETELPQNEPEDIPDVPDDNDAGEDSSVIPKEYLEKIKAIYSQVTTGPQDITTISRLSILTSKSSTINGCGPISVTPATLNGEEITLVTLGGMQDVEGQATTIEESQKAAFGQPNAYLSAVCSLFANGTVPASKPVMVSGYSLGGMIAQQIAGVKKITDKFDIKAIITFGSPFTLPFDRNGIKVIRFADVSDGVPKLGEQVIRSGIVPVNSLSTEEINNKIDALDKIEKITRSGKYTHPILTHAMSYIEDECWNDIDFLGDKEKKNVIRLQEEMSFFHAPK